MIEDAIGVCWVDTLSLNAIISEVGAVGITPIDTIHRHGKVLSFRE